MAIAFDNKAGGGSTQLGSSPATLTLSHTVNSNTNGIILVSVKGDGTNQATMTQPTVTYNAVSLTYITDITLNASTGHLWNYYLVAPASGANNVVVTQGATKAQFLSVASVSYTGVNQSSPIDITATTSGTVVGTLTASATTSVDNDWGVYFVSGNGTIAASTNTTERVAGGVQPAHFIGDTNADQTPAGSKSMSVTTAVDGNEVGIVSFLSPVGGAVAVASRKTLLGVGK